MPDLVSLPATRETQFLIDAPDVLPGLVELEEQLTFQAHCVRRESARTTLAGADSQPRASTTAGNTTATVAPLQSFAHVFAQGNTVTNLQVASAPYDRIFIGDQHGQIVVVQGEERYDWGGTSWLVSGVLAGGVVEVGYNDVIDGTAGRDKIDGLGGNDALDGGEGDDDIDGGDGHDLLGGGHGVDHIYGGIGNDFILSADTLTVSQRLGPGEVWNAPAGTITLVAGSNWGVYVTADGSSSIISGASGSQRDAAGDYIYAGEGDDLVIGSDGSDTINGDAGSDAVWGAGGDDIIDGGDNNDVLRGDGPVQPGLLDSTGAELHGSDLLIGGSGRDLLYGNGGNDELFGGSDGDYLYGDDTEGGTPPGFHGEDFLDGGTGDDELVGGAKDDRLYGGDDDDKLWGDAGSVAADSPSFIPATLHGDDYLDGGKGNDVLVGEAGADTLMGGDDNDWLFGDDAPDVLTGSTHGNDYLDGGQGNDLLVGGGGDDDMSGGSGDDIMLGDDAADRLSHEFHGSDTLRGEGGNDRLFGGAGSDNLFGGDDDDYLRGGDDPTALPENLDLDDFIDGEAGNDTLDGDGGEDQLLGGSGHDVIRGGSGGDTIIGGADADELLGGAGNDYYMFYATHGALAPDGSAEYLSDMEGINSAYFDVLLEDVSVDIIGGGSLQIRYGESDYLIVLNGLNASLSSYTFAGETRLTYRQFIAHALANTVVMTTPDGRTVAYGGRDSDTFVLGAADFVTGGGGADTYVVNADSVGAIIDATGSTASATDLIMIETVSPNGLGFSQSGENLLLTYGNGQQYIWLSDFWLNNVEVSVQVHGVTATLAAGTPGQYVFVQPVGSDVETVSTNASYVLAETFENAVLTESANANLQGNALSNSLVGNAGNNVIAGAAGNDIIWGNEGNDTLDGGAGDDSLVGGDGNDLLTGGVGHDLFYGGNGTDTLLGGTGDDRIYASYDSDDIRGGAGVDFLYGEAGGDTYRFGRGDGHDFIFHSRPSDAAAATDRILFSAGIATTNVSLRRDGNHLLVLLDDGDADRLTVQDYFNSLNSLDALSIQFADGTTWSASDIQARVINQTITVTSVDGIDTVVTDGSYVLAADQENLTLTGNYGATLEGNTAANVLTGNDGDNLFNGPVQYPWRLDATMDLETLGSIFRGGYGVYSWQDTLIGRGGNDTYILGSGVTEGPDVSVQLQGIIIEEAGEGIDTILLLAYHGTMAANVENLVAYSTAQWGHWEGSIWVPVIHAIVGNDSANVIDTTRVNGTTLIDGGAGADTMIGSTTSETIYYVDSLQDVIVDAADEYNRNTVRASIDHTLTDVVHNLELMEGATQGTGNALDNTLGYGSNQTQALTLRGLTGNDTYRIRSGDQVIEAANEGFDTVVVAAFQDSVSTFYAADYENVEALRIDWRGTLVGDARDNVLIGGNQGDTLNGGGGNDRLEDSDVRILNDWEEAADSDIFNGGDGNDVIVSSQGNDLIRGEAGNDRIVLSDWYKGDATVLFGRGDGNDTVEVAEDAPYKLLNLTFDADIDVTDIAVYREGDDLRIGIAGGGGSITILDAWGEGAADETMRVALSLQFQSHLSRSWDDFYGFIEARLRAGDANVGTEQDDVLLGTRGVDALNGAAGSDRLFGGQGDDVLSGGSGYDRLWGGSGADRLAAGADDDYADGGDGDDVYVINAADGGLTIRDSGGYDVIEFGAGIAATDIRFSRDEYLTLYTDDEDLYAQITRSWADPNAENSPEVSTIEEVRFADGTVWTYDQIVEMAKRIDGTADADTIYGTSKEDHIYGYAGNDIIDAGAGNDLIDGGTGNDDMTGGDGDDTFFVDNTQDRVRETSTGGTDVVVSSITLTLASNGNVENLTLTGTSAINGTGNSLNNVITGNSAANTLTGNNGDDTLYGGGGNDSLSGGAGADTLVGGIGTDTLNGGAGNDTYRFGRGDGADTLTDNDTTAGNSDLLQFLSGVASEQIWFRQVGNNLEVSVIGTGDKLTLSNWYVGTQYRVETFRTEDGRTLLSTQVLNLVNAMAGFSPPAAGQLTLPDNYRTALAPVLAANWQ